MIKINVKFLLLAGIFGLEDGKLVERLDKEFEDIAAITLLYKDSCNPDDYKKVAKEIRKYYLKDKKIDMSKRKELTDVSYFF